MFGMMRNPSQSYATVGVDITVNSADPHKLILILFDGAISASNIAKVQIEQKNISEKGNSISKAIGIVLDGLKASLDIESGGELAERLSALYDYIAQRLLFANLHNSTAALDEAIQLLGSLREAWAQISPDDQQAA